ncbi:MAG: hypothetical protein IT583_06180 [Verrucomicrobia bacterium]|nr:hypothetical protein [Verrucomicrobiota bacterium]
MKRTFIVLVEVLLLCGIGIFIYGFLPGKDVIIARAIAPDGTDLCVTHKSNHTGEPYTVNFYFKRPGNPWGWFYYEHEDTRWFRGSIKLNAQGTTAFIKRGWRTVAIFDLTTDSFTIKRWNRTIQGAQNWMPTDWTPEQEIKNPKL